MSPGWRWFWFILAGILVGIFVPWPYSLLLGAGAILDTLTYPACGRRHE